jgi:acyl dehydratase
VINYDDIEVGDELPGLSAPIARLDLVRYAGASRDFNVIHWNERVATSVGLPNVIAHGMLTMAIAGRVVTDWLGDPGAVVEYSVRFTRPVVVPDPEGATLEVSARVASKQDGLVGIDITAKSDGQTVLSRARLTARVGASPTGPTSPAEGS